MDDCIGFAAASDWPALSWTAGKFNFRRDKSARIWGTNGPPVLWEKSIGTGYSAPSVRGNRIVFHHRVKDQELSSALMLRREMLFGGMHIRAHLLIRYGATITDLGATPLLHNESMLHVPCRRKIALPGIGHWQIDLAT